MRLLEKQLKQHVPFWALLFLFFAASPAKSATDIEAQENFAKARARSHQKEIDHTFHQDPLDKSLEFRGIFYGYLPCEDCDGIKTTLSLKQRNNYLLVTQPAKESAREFYEKGKYEWNEKEQKVILTPKKGGAKIRYFQIRDSATLLQLGENGMPLGKNANRYILQRSDAAKTREVHIH